MYALILAQTLQTVNGYRTKNYDIKTIAYMRMVRYYR